jgi:hypothetical protein
VAVDGEQWALVGRVDVRDAAHDQPRGHLQLLRFARERSEGDFRDLGFADPALGVVVPDRVGVLDRRPRVGRDGVDRHADRRKQARGDREVGPLPQHCGDDVGLVERRVHPGDQQPGRAAALGGQQGVGDEPVGALRAVGLAPTQPGAGDHRRGPRRRDDAEQRVQALHAGVAATGAFLGVAVGRLHRVVDVHVGQRVRPGQQRGVAAQVDHQSGGDRVELPDMTEGERTQERPQRGRRPDAGEQPVHRAVPQHRHVLDAVGAGDHARDQRRDLQSSVAAAGLVDPDVLTGQVLQAGSFRDLQHGRQAGARHEVGVIEHCPEAVRDSHLPDVLPLWLNRSLDKTDSPTTEGHLGFTARDERAQNTTTGGSGLRSCRLP